MKNLKHHPLLTIRTAGLLCFWTALIGAASGVFLAFVEPAVPENQWSYPLDVTAFSAIQVWFALQHLGLLLGLLALQWTGAAGRSRTGRAGHFVAVASMLGFAATELAAISAAHDTKDSAAVGQLGATYGVFSILLGAALVMVGIAVVRAGVWQDWSRWIPLALGVWVFVPMLPALALSFTGARFAIAGWMLLFAALGWALANHDEGTVRTKPGAARRERNRRPSVARPAP